MAMERSLGSVSPLSERGRGPESVRVEVRRSGRRRRTVSAYREGGRTIVLIPARFTKAEERHWVETMLGRLAAGDRRRRPGDTELEDRALELSVRYLGGRARPSSVRWVGNQMSRWGSCTPADRTIRVSDRLKGVPAYVLDYVLLHELAHLLRPAHDREFWRLLEAYPRVERARGFLDGFAAASGLGTAWQDDAPEGNSTIRGRTASRPEPGEEVDARPRTLF